MFGDTLGKFEALLGPQTYIALILKTLQMVTKEFEKEFIEIIREQMLSHLPIVATGLCLTYMWCRRLDSPDTQLESDKQDGVRSQQ